MTSILDTFQDQLGIKCTTWSVCYVNGKKWSLGDKNLDHPLTSDQNKELKIVYNYRWFDENFKSQNADLTGTAKNNTIGEVWKGIDNLYKKHGLEGIDHRFIEIIEIKGNVLKFHTGS